MKGIGGDGTEIVAPWVTSTVNGDFIIYVESNSSNATGNIDSFCSGSGSRGVFLKFASDGSDIEWSKCYHNDGDSFLIYLFEKGDGTKLLGGEFNSDNGWGFTISKHDALDNVLWQRSYSKGNGAILLSMIAVDDGYIMLGESYYVDSNVLIHYGGAMDADLWVLKVDTNGNKVWSKVIGGTGHESGAALVAGPGNGCYVVGGTGSYDNDCTGNHGGGEVYIARLDKNGNILWHRDAGGSHEDVGTNACSNGKGGLIVTALTHSGDGDVNNYSGGSDYWTMEIDSSNNMLWNNCYGLAGGEMKFPYQYAKQLMVLYG